MKIIYIANIRIPTEKAHGIQIMKMCEAFANTGNEVELVVPRRLNHLKENPFEYFDVKKNFKIVKLPTLDLIKFGKIGFWIQSVSFAKFAAIYTLFKKSDLIYSRDEFSTFFVSFVKNNVFFEAHMNRENYLIKSFLKRVSGMVTVSNGLEDFYQKLNKNLRIFVAPNGVDLEEFSKKIDINQRKKELGISLEKPIVMYIGLLDPWKGVETLLKASKVLNDVKVVIIGGGKSLEGFKREYPNVKFLGFLPYRDLALNQKTADVLVVPNSAKDVISSLYTSPIKIFAHMTSSIPIVASDLPSINEILDNNNSVFFEPDNLVDLAEKIQKVLLNETLSYNISKKAFIDVRKYSWNKRSRNVANFLKKQ